MAAIYQADNWCDDCANQIRATIRAERLQNGHEPFDEDNESSYDSYQLPKAASDDEESDCPCHCAAGAECLNAITLDSGTKIGELFGALTSEGVEYVRKAIIEGGEVAKLWKKHYEDMGYDFEVAQCPHCKEWHAND